MKPFKVQIGKQAIKARQSAIRKLWELLVNPAAVTRAVKIGASKTNLVHESLEDRTWDFDLVVAYVAKTFEDPESMSDNDLIAVLGAWLDAVGGTRQVDVRRAKFSSLRFLDDVHEIRFHTLTKESRQTCWTAIFVSGSSESMQSSLSSLPFARIRETVITEEDYQERRCDLS